MKAIFFCGWYFLVLLLIKQVVVCSIKKRFICDNSSLKSDSLASITEERLDDNFENIALLASCSSSSSSFICHNKKRGIYKYSKLDRARRPPKNQATGPGYSGVHNNC